MRWPWQKKTKTKLVRLNPDQFQDIVTSTLGAMGKDISFWWHTSYQKAALVQNHFGRGQVWIHRWEMDNRIHGGPERIYSLIWKKVKELEWQNAPEYQI